MIGTLTMLGLGNYIDRLQAREAARERSPGLETVRLRLELNPGNAAARRLLNEARSGH